jgi:hypothetical protein
MCVVSNIGDHYKRQWQPLVASVYQWPQQEVKRAEFDKLKAEVEECLELLRAAKKIDDKLGTPDCEMDEKLDVIRRVCELVGVSLDDALAGV